MKRKKQFYIIIIALLAAVGMLASACSQTYEKQPEPARDNPPEIQEDIVEDSDDGSAGSAEAVGDDEHAPGPGDSAEGLGNRSVFFAHNSVGQNIIDGIGALGAGIPILNEQQIGENGIAEVYLGYNGDPAGKMAAFKDSMANGGSNARIAFFKFCYTDFDEGTDSDDLFDRYAGLMAELEGMYPDVTFVHVTAPLYDYNASYHNNRQHTFNEKMRAKYGAYVFDLAAIESVDASGNQTLSRDGVTPALADDWSSDGSHLNDAGGKRVAAELISFLGSVALG